MNLPPICVEPVFLEPVCRERVCHEPVCIEPLTVWALLDRTALVYPEPLYVGPIVDPVPGLGFR